MKKAILLTVFSVFLLASKSEAQGFGFVTSFGVTQQWDVPYDVYYTIDNTYLGYNWVHAQRVYNNHGRLFYDVTLQRGDIFVRVSVDRFGRIHNRRISYSYPFANHVCNDFCGFHSNFYVNNRIVCSGHNHYGHNHVTYRPVVVNYNHPKGHAHGYYKNKKSKQYGYHEEVYRPANRRSGAAIVSNRSKSRLDLDKGRNGGHGYGHGNDNKGNQGHGYGRGNHKGNNGNNGKGYGRDGNRGNNGNAYGKGKDTGKGAGLGRGRGDGSNHTQDDRSSRGKNKATSSRPTYRSRLD